MAMMQTKGLYKSLLGTQEQPNEPALLANGASNDEKKNHKALKDAYNYNSETRHRHFVIWYGTSMLKYLRRVNRFLIRLLI